MARTDNLTNFLTDVAGAIREKKGTTEPIVASNFDTEIASIEGGGIEPFITDCSYLFYNGARMNHLSDIISLCINVTSTSNMFRNSFYQGGVDLSLLDISNVTNMSSMFDGNYNISSINMSNWDASKVISMGSMFSSCNNLSNIIGCLNNLGKGFTQKTTNYYSYKLDLSSSSNLTHDSLMNIINGLYDLNLTYDVANGGTLYTQSLQLGATNMAKLTEEEIAIATNKGWTIS